MVLKRVGIWSVAKMLGAVYAAIGLLFGCFFALFSMLGAGLTALSDSSGPEGLVGMLFGVGAIIILPLFYGVLGTLFGALGAALYNLFANLVGGIRLELQ